ncbi:thermonuclease family protein [Candidatus Nitrospira bockiana]
MRSGVCAKSLAGMMWLCLMTTQLGVPPAAAGSESGRQCKDKHVGVQRPAAKAPAPVAIPRLRGRRQHSLRPLIRAYRRSLHQRRLAVDPPGGVFEGTRPLDSWKIYPIDGDTFAYDGRRIRIQGVNAPELGQAGGFEAKTRLEHLLKGGAVTIVPRGTDVYGRTVADVFVDQQNVADVLIREGLARR